MSREPDPIDVLVIGPAGHPTGGIARYIAEQRRRLPDAVSVRIHDTATPIGSGPWWFVRASWSALRTAASFIARRPADVVHVHTSHWFSFVVSAFYVFVAAYGWRRPVVLHVHGSAFEEFVRTDSRLVALLQSLTFSATDRVIVLSPHWRDVLEGSVPPEKLTVLPNAIDVDEYHPGGGQRAPHVVFISNLIERKGLPAFVAAIDDLAERLPHPFAVSIAGSGPLSELAADLAARHQGVTYHGYVDEATKRRLLSDGTIYVLPTHTEGLPIAILEAMAGGNAIVSTPVGGIPDLVDAETGILVAPGDPPALADALADLLGDPARVQSMAETGRRRVASLYSWDVVTAELVSMYRELVGVVGGESPERPDGRA